MQASTNAANAVAYDDFEEEEMAEIITKSQVVTPKQQAIPVKATPKSAAKSQVVTPKSAQSARQTPVKATPKSAAQSAAKSPVVTPKQQANFDVIDDNEDDEEIIAKSSRKSSAKEPKQAVYDLDELCENVEIPTIEEFKQSQPYQFIKFMIENCATTPKLRMNLALKTPIKISTINAKTFNSEAFTEQFYDNFVAAYKIRKATRDALYEDTDYCFKGHKVMNKSEIIVMLTEEHLKTLKVFDNFVNEIYQNISFDFKATAQVPKKSAKSTAASAKSTAASAKSTKSAKSAASAEEDDEEIKEKTVINYELIAKMMQLQIMKTINVFDVTQDDKLTKDLVDFAKFNFMYDPEIPYHEPSISKQEAVMLYHEIFDRSNITKPIEIFNRRGGLIIANPKLKKELRTAQIKQLMANFKGSTEAVDKIFEAIVYSPQLRYIVFCNYSMNPIIAKVFGLVFKADRFIELLANKLYPICYMFTPYMFNSPELRAVMQTTEGKRKMLTTLATRRNYIVGQIPMYESSIIYNNQYWLSLIGTTPATNKLWFEIVEKKQTKKQAAAPKKQSKKQEFTDEMLYDDAEAADEMAVVTNENIDAFGEASENGEEENAEEDNEVEDAF